MNAQKILLLIDDPGFRGRLLPVLRARGLSTILTGDGEHARSLIAREAPVLVVVDARIPGMTGFDWIRARRDNGVAIPMILCASSKEEMNAWAANGGPLNLESVVNRGLSPETFAKHIADVVAMQAPPPEPSLDDILDVAPGGGAGSEELEAALEKLRTSLVTLQQNPERRERVEAAITAAGKLEQLAARLGSQPVVAAARSIGGILNEALEGRRRMDGASFTEVERFMVRARDAAPQVRFASPAARPEAPPVSASAHDGDEFSFSGPAATHDELTSLLSRPTFHHHLNEFLSGAMISNRPLSVCAIVLVGEDELRRNGLLDSALAGTGRFLAGRFRPADRRGRWDAATLAVAIPGTPAPMVVDVMRRTIEAIAQTRITDESGARIDVALGAGVVSFPKDGRDAEALLAFAEQLARRAAASGGGVRTATG